MNTKIDDVKLTAYVLGELDEAERQEVESRITESDETRRAVEEIRRVAGLLTAAYRNESMPSLSAVQRDRIQQKAGEGVATPSFVAAFRKTRWALVPLAVAAVMVFAVLLRHRDRASAIRLADAKPLKPSMRRIVEKLPSETLYEADEARGLSAPVASLQSQLESDHFLAIRELEDALRRTPVGATNSNSNTANMRLRWLDAAATGDMKNQGPIQQDNALIFNSPGGTQVASLDSRTFRAKSELDPSAPNADVSLQVPGDPDLNVDYALSAIGEKGGTDNVNMGFEGVRLNQDNLAEPGTSQGARKSKSVQPENVLYGYQVPYTKSSRGVFSNSQPDYAAQIDLSDRGARANNLTREHEPNSGEAYEAALLNSFHDVSSQPLSTFSIDVDTASYSNVRRMLNQNVRPQAAAVRIEEMVNYFDYVYAPPVNGEPFAVHVETSECPWNIDHRLVRIGLKGAEIDAETRPRANLVFLIDVSGSMQHPVKLPLVQAALRMLVAELNPDDVVSMAVYAGASGLVLEPTECRNQHVILSAIDALQAGGSTNGGQGIQLAYEVAAEGFIDGGVNRVILATDGDFNVGITNQYELVSLIEEKATSGVFLSVLGFGMGNLKDAMLEKLADKGNGNYAYIDTLNEARKVLVDQLEGTLVTIAKDVKIQVEFNPLQVRSYRLIGYENRMLAARDFNDDTKDAGEIGAGHSVTALYELVPAELPDEAPAVDPLKYQADGIATDAAESGELLTVKLRYKRPDEDVSQLIEVPVRDTGATFEQSSDDFIFAASVATFGMLLRGDRDVSEITFDDVAGWASGGIGEDAFGYRAEFLTLVERAKYVFQAQSGGPVP